MKHPIDPKVDCVFKAILGSPENSNLLVNFINAALGEHLAYPVKSVEILNPYNEREFINDKLSIVDIKAQDTEERLFQIEIQLASYPSLPARMLYNWADIYSQQLKSGENYGELKACYAIWLLNDNIHQDDEYLHHYQLRDDQGYALSEHCHITLLELKKFHHQTITNNLSRWLQFFNEAEALDDTALPQWMQTKEMQQAMNTLSRFSEKDRAYFAYQARQEYIREQNTIKFEREQELLAKQKIIDSLAGEAEKIIQETAVAQQEAIAAQQKTAIAQQETIQAHQETAQAQQEAEQAHQETAQAQQEAAQAQQEVIQAQQAKNAALTEITKLKALLANQNKNNDDY